MIPNFFCVVHAAFTLARAQFISSLLSKSFLCGTLLCSIDFTILPALIIISKLWLSCYFLLTRESRERSRSKDSIIFNVVEAERIKFRHF